MMGRLMASAAALAFVVTAAEAAQVTFYQLPSGAYPPDVSPAPDAKVGYSGQQLGVLGVFDPKTGKAEHVSLGSNSSPHGVITAPDGSAWLTDGGQNAMVRFDPATRAIKVFPLPKEFPRANLNTAVVDKRGIVWFTGQSGVYGRVDPKSGKVDAWASPRGRGPYGITTTPAGEVWYASLAGNHIARIDLATGEATVFDPPTKDQGARRVWSDSRGRLWVSYWNTGQVGMYDPASKAWREWKLPGESPRAY